MIPDRDDLIRINHHDVEKILQVSLKQQFYYHNIPLTSIDRTPLPYTPDGGIDIAIEIPENHSMPDASFYNPHGIESEQLLEPHEYAKDIKNLLSNASKNIDKLLQEL